MEKHYSLRNENMVERILGTRLNFWHRGSLEMKKDSDGDYSQATAYIELSFCNDEPPNHIYIFELPQGCIGLSFDKVDHAERNFKCKLELKTAGFFFEFPWDIACNLPLDIGNLYLRHEQDGRYTCYFV